MKKKDNLLKQHKFHAGVNLFMGMKEFISCGGLNIIEDVWPSDHEKYKNFLKNELENFEPLFVNLHRPDVRISDNRMIVVRRIS